MKKTICFFIILAQAFLFLSYAETQTGNTATQAQPEQVAPAATSQPAETTPKAEEVKPPVVQKEVPKKEIKKELPKEEIKTELPTEEMKSEEPQEEVKERAPRKAPPEVQGTVVLRERVSDQNPLRKIARGAVNTTLGWVEIPRQMIKENKAKGDIAAVFWGPLKGFAFFVGRTAVGLYEVTTFLIPPYKPVVTPEFILSDDDSD